MVSLIWDGRAFPVYWQLLDKQGSSNYHEQTSALSLVLPLLKDYQVVVLADREFCSVKLGNWLQEKKTRFCLRLRKNEFIQTKNEVWQSLEQLGLSPGNSLFLQGVKVTKKKGYGQFNVAAKWKRKIHGLSTEEGWFILTNLDDLAMAITAYKKRFGIEEMFRDFKSGGYDLEGTHVCHERLIRTILLIAIAYTSSTFVGTAIKHKGLQHYVGRIKESKRIERRHSSFYVGLYGQLWVNSQVVDLSEVRELMQLRRNKIKYYQRGKRAIRLILQASYL